jgi:hypothetical protein
MRIGLIHICAFILGILALFSMACNNGSNTDLSYKAAINDHFKAYPVCIWSQPKSFPCRRQLRTMQKPKVMTL